MKALYALVIAAAATGLTIPAIADTPPPPDQQSPYQQSPYQQSPDQQSYRTPKHERAGRMTREQKLAWKAELREKLKGMPREQRKAYKQQMRAEFKAMDPQHRQQRLAELDHRWNSMPADMQQKLLNKTNKHGGQTGEKSKGHKHRDQTSDDDSTE